MVIKCLQPPDDVNGTKQNDLTTNNNGINLTTKLNDKTKQQKHRRRLEKVTVLARTVRLQLVRGMFR